ncbi:DNA polymerase delta subunit 2 [Monocercomonoides exilis]|uniref:DNA polymerase delta subunit 2 n=1 Tax=Monocercomonoides exilis TaxID=2049356 RepID=UPI0035595F7D|nr:DNA polymerase delta subunit 2 [Monocercomonoides exilis]|eukprot:MONOS_1312.1-p1 / transcript=MONOS_1312.1 / gene=MONOS_1312 / organism=Monocercomonoides_exilis_PA203 / gene_product=DNA polymerase delta subunit 2 / transcript_product=DNA polymerase delta subunit 2 / location=Mono_scaffold00022:166460-168144(+) / protein_length=493 / sequence_SO=supercontig / SO=protein_coding / is_pseudo=false
MSNTNKSEPTVCVLNEDSEYFVKKPEFSHQFDSIYSQREAITLPLLKQAIRRKWPDTTFKDQLLLLTTDPTLTISVCGLVFKESKKRPNVIKQFQKDRSLTTLYKDDCKYIDPEDTIFLEDSHSRVQLIGNISPDLYVTGVPLAVKGHVEEAGKLTVEDVTTLQLPPQKKVAMSSSAFSIAFLSDLRIGSTDHDPLRLELATDYLSSLNAGLESSSSSSSSNTNIHLVISGSSLTPTRPIERQFKEFSAYAPQKIVSPTQELDEVVSRLCESMTVALIPGGKDPSNHFLPQQPFHHLLLPQSFKMSTFIPATNPHRERVNNMLVIGTSGQNLNDITRFTTLSPLDALEKLLRWNHICPSAPDITGVYPFSDTDPFILDETPSILFAGGMKQFEWKIVEEGDLRCLLLLVPSFSKTGDLIIVDPKTLIPRVVNFNVGLSAENAEHLLEDGKGATGSALLGHKGVDESGKTNQGADDDVVIDELDENEMEDGEG